MTNAEKFELREQALGNDESFSMEICYFDSRCYDLSLLNNILFSCSGSSVFDVTPNLKFLWI